MKFTKKTFVILSLFILPFALVSAQQEIYKNQNYSFEDRVEDLLNRLTVEEKVGLMMDNSNAVERLGIKTYNWWNEALHGVARAGLATVFPQPIGMAATFNEKAIYDVFSVVSDEARAKHSAFSAKGEFGRYQGLTMWTPTINIFRDPRWGRGIETYGEDPYLTSVMGVSVVKGLQGEKKGSFDKIHACAKHFAVHSGPEWNRHSYNAENISLRDLHETYLPAFKALVQDAKVKEVMCAYNRFEGDPCCGSNRLLVDILRNKWNFNGIVVADCGAISDFFRPNAHETHSNAATASAAAVLSGTDLDCGSSYRALVESVKAGYITEKELDVSVRRLLKARFELGEMDDNANNPWAEIPYSVVASDAHDKLSLEIARQSMTLLLNKNNILPLKKGGLNIAVMGPNANDSVMQWGNYNGTPRKTITILDGIRSYLGANDNLIFEQGCSWVEQTLMESGFSQCVSENGRGFSAKYWNNLTREGAHVATAQITTPFIFNASGATVFAPGVNLTDFSATYNTVFTPEKTGEVEFEFYANGFVQLFINDVEVKSVRANHGGRKTTHSMKMEGNKPYNIRIDFAYTRGDAQLNFDFGMKEEINIQKSIEKVKSADVVLFVGGISPSLEGEEMGVNLPGFRGGDRTDIELPAVQRELIAGLKKAGKKVIFINCSGSPIAMEPEVENCEAILQAWYPGQSGGKAVADVIFGNYNPAGRLPVTFYKNNDQLPDFENYDMKGRTYRYLHSAPLFPFGYGLSYTTFKYGKAKLNKKTIKLNQPLRLSVNVSNSGKMDGEEVVQVYLRRVGDFDGPILSLRDFKRVFIPAGKSKKVDFELSGSQLEWWNEATGEVEIHPGKFEVFAGPNSKIYDLKKVGVVELK